MANAIVAHLSGRGVRVWFRPALWFAALAWGMAACNRSRPPPDVFIISVDTLRTDHVSAYNPASPASTPHIDSMVADGVRFTQAFTPVSVTGPAFASVMTGLAPESHGVFTNLFRGGDALSDEHTTLAELFATQGYRTGAFVSAFTLRRALGLDQGFAVYNGGEEKNRDGSVTAETMVSWLSVQEGPVFGWFHTFDPHGPLARMATPEDFAKEWESNPLHQKHLPMYQRIGDVTQHELYETLYARGVERADASVGTVLQALKALDRYDDAVVVVLADHGEGFRERGLWYDHGTSAHVEQTHVPLVIKYADARHAGRTDERLVSLVDVAPTIVDAVGLPAQRLDGHSLRGTAGVRRVVTSESSHCKRVDVLDCAPAGGQGKEIAVRSIEQTLVSKSTELGEREEVYDRSAHPDEIRPSQGEASAALAAELKRVRSDRRARQYGPLPDVHARDATSEKLRSLGYME